MGCLASAEATRSAAAVAATGPIGLTASVDVVVFVLDESSFLRTTSQITKAAATASATTAPIRTLERRAQPVSRASLTQGKNRACLGGRKREPRVLLAATAKPRRPVRTIVATAAKGGRGRRLGVRLAGRACRQPRGYNRLARAVSSVGRAPARQAGRHWSEPSTAHFTLPAHAGSAWLSGRGMRGRLP